METATQTTSTFLSHDEYPLALEQAVQNARARIRVQGDQPDATVAQQLQVVDELLQFGLGRYLLVHQGLNGYWTRYMAGLQPGCGLDVGVNDEGNPFSDLERWMLDLSPGAYIIKERMRMAQEILQPQVRDGAVFASLPCGAMDDLLSLRDFAPLRELAPAPLDNSKHPERPQGVANKGAQPPPQVRLVGIDVDPLSLRLAQQNARERGLEHCAEFVQADAWHLGIANRFDAMICHGLISYVQDLQRVQELYAQLYCALKTGGILISCFVPPPPSEGPSSSWDMEQIGEENIQRYNLVYQHVLQPKWEGNHRTHQQITDTFRRVGFSKINLCPDSRGICVTVVATK